MVKSIKTTRRTNNQDNCLSLAQTLNDTIPFAMRSRNCKKNRSVVCVLKTSAQISYQRLPKFPCIPKYQPTREKRQVTGEGPGMDDDVKKGRDISYIWK